MYLFEQNINDQNVSFNNITCLPNYYYNGSECLECLTGAWCYNNELTPLKGYWKMNSTTLSLY